MLSSNKQPYVYKLIDPRTDQVFYIGKGTGRRMYSHETEAHHTSVNVVHRTGKSMDISYRMKINAVYAASTPWYAEE